MKKLSKLLLCILLAACMVLASCDRATEEDDEEGTVARRTKEKTEATEAPADDTPSGPVELVAQIEEENMNLPVGRLVGDKAITVHVEGVDVKLDYQGWPTVCKGDGDTLYAASSLRTKHVDPFGCNVFYKSEDGGKTWSDPVIINDTPLDDRDAGLVYLGNGKLVMTFFTIGVKDFVDGGEYADSCWSRVSLDARQAKLKQWSKLSEEEKLNGSYVMTSYDYGATWTEPKLMPISCPHGPTLGNDGRTLYYIGLGSGKSGKYPGFESLEYGLHVLYSRDAGQNWYHKGTIPIPTLPTEGEWGYWEPYVIQKKDGTFLAALRTGRSDKDSNATLGILISHSKDGVTWTMAEQIESVVGAPAHFLELSNGAILLTYSHRLPHCGSRGRISYDGGYTWSEEEIIISKSYNPSNGDLGYPSTVELSDGTLITTYYQAYGDDPVPSLLYTRWRLVEKTSEHDK